MSRGNPVERDPVAGHGEALTEVRNRTEATHDRGAQQYLQGVQRTRCQNHPPRAQDGGASLVPVVEPNLVAPPGTGSIVCTVHRSRSTAPALMALGNQRPVHALLGTDIAAEHAAVAVRARRFGRRIVACPADRLGRRPDFPMFLVGECRQQREFALILRPRRNCEGALDSVVVRCEFVNRQFGRQRVVELGRRTMQIRAAHHRVAAHGRGVHDDGAVV